jgi:ABC-type branched-subunit amino acid transport system ATPase component
MLLLSRKSWAETTSRLEPNGGSPVRRGNNAGPLMAIVAEGVTKSFAGLRVLDNVGLSVAEAEIHALLGANGSGKSTLAKILSGVYQPERASITIKDRNIPAIVSPQHASDLGVAIVHQEAPLIDSASALNASRSIAATRRVRDSSSGGGFTARSRRCSNDPEFALIRAHWLAAWRRRNGRLFLS